MTTGPDLTLCLVCILKAMTTTYNPCRSIRYFLNGGQVFSVPQILDNYLCWQFIERCYLLQPDRA